MSHCSKVRFNSRRGAEAALEDIWSRPGEVGRKREIRCYRCPDCKGWHLTSEASRHARSGR